MKACFSFLFVFILTLSTHASFDPSKEDDIVKLCEERNKLLALDAELDRALIGYESIRHAAFVARLLKGNMFLFGPPGGAKSAFVQKMLNAECVPYFKLQLNPMLTEHAFVGAQSLESLQKGEFRVNFEGTLGNFALALIDELDKGNAAALGSLLSLLNEREIWAGGQVFKTKTETFFSTSNKNLVDFYAGFKKRGEESTADALLDRLQFKAFAYNWLKKEHQKIIDDAHFAWFSQETEEDTLEACNSIDWAFLRQAAKSLFKLDDAFKQDFQDFIHAFNKDLPKKTNTYIPNAQMSERLRQNIPSVILFSVFVDFLLSPLSKNEELLRSAFQQKLSVDYHSLWRSYLVLTTIVPGKTSLSININDPTLEFSDTLKTATARDVREQDTFNNIENEQNLLAAAFGQILKNAGIRNLGEQSEGIDLLTADRSIELQLLENQKK